MYPPSKIMYLSSSVELQSSWNTNALPNAYSIAYSLPNTLIMKSLHLTDPMELSDDDRVPTPTLMEKLAELLTGTL